MEVNDESFINLVRLVVLIFIPFLFVYMRLKIHSSQLEFLLKFLYLINNEMVVCHFVTGRDPLMHLPPDVVTDMWASWA